MRIPVLVTGLWLTACGPGVRGDHADPVVELCTEVSATANSCAGHAIECPETGPCASAECLDRGHKAATSSETCGEMWRAAYECVVDLGCHEFEQWFDGRWFDEPSYPCVEPEIEFREACPDLPLFDGEN